MSEPCSLPTEDADLIARAIAAFAQTSGQAAQVDTVAGALQVEVAGQVFPITVRRGVDRRAALGALAAAVPRPLLVTEYLSPELSDCCRQLELPFLDSAGNAYVQAEGQFIWISGRPRPVAPKLAARATTRSGLMVSFGLLCQPALRQASTRTLSEALGISLGSVSAAIRDLEQRGHLMRRGRGQGIYIRSWARLLDEWLLEFPLRLQPHLAQRRFRIPDTDWWQSVDPQTYGGQWGGEVGAVHYGAPLQPERISLYLAPRTAGIGLARLVREQRLRADPDGILEVITGFWDPVALQLAGAWVPLPLVMADLQASLDPRNLDVMQPLKEAWIAGADATT